MVSAGLPAAQRLARVVGRWITVLPMMDPGEMTISEEDMQFVRHRPFCDVRLPDGRRCLLHGSPNGECARRLGR
ncbi:hypothetical protein AB0J20_02995 [Micromonospora costi]|uniref:hypothetical protein n=1 Tax=Micromonospora costi TaxID=1530042 RepID=UPI003408A053